MKYLFILLLCFGCVPKDRIYDVYIVNGDIEYMYQGKHYVVETKDEQEIYHFDFEGKEMTFRHIRAHCKWNEDSVYTCKNYIIFKDNLYLAETIE